MNTKTALSKLAALRSMIEKIKAAAEREDEAGIGGIGEGPVDEASTLAQELDDGLRE